jgi:hypothetical protein
VPAAYLFFGLADSYDKYDSLPLSSAAYLFSGLADSYDKYDSLPLSSAAYWVAAYQPSDYALGVVTGNERLATRPVAKTALTGVRARNA